VRHRWATAFVRMRAWGERGRGYLRLDLLDCLLACLVVKRCSSVVMMVHVHAQDGKLHIIMVCMQGGRGGEMLRYDRRRIDLSNDFLGGGIHHLAWRVQRTVR